MTRGSQIVVEQITTKVKIHAVERAREQDLFAALVFTARQNWADLIDEYVAATARENWGDGTTNPLNSAASTPYPFEVESYKQTHDYYKPHKSHDEYAWLINDKEDKPVNDESEPVSKPVNIKDSNEDRPIKINNNHIQHHTS